MPRMLRGFRSRTLQANAESALREQLLRDLDREAQTLLKQLTQKFTQDLESQATTLLSALTRGASRSQATGANPRNDAFPDAVLAALRYGLNAPRTRESSVREESSRSQEAEQQFRLSQSQQIAEAGTALNRGNKNS